MTNNTRHTDSAHRKAEEFLAVAGDFHLGTLPTEMRHPETMQLAELAQHDIPTALSILKKIEADTLAQIVAYQPRLAPLQIAIRETLFAGNRVFFYGCGATGRLSLCLEYIWRFIHRDNPAMADRVQGFMSGGDLALVHSIENFEDHPEFGARQLREIGFGAQDLLIATTEGGETPSVIGATEEAAQLSSRKPFYLYCNPAEILKTSVERSRRVLENDCIHNICLYVGPMYLAGSTRLQASTVLMLGAGSALMAAVPTLPVPETKQLYDFIGQLDNSFLQDFIEEESRLYAQGDYLLYETVSHGMTILTDTTERAPTFSLRGFENQNNPQRVPALSYLCLPAADTAEKAWQDILLRNPLPLEWDELKDIAGYERLMGFDFSLQARGQRAALVAPHRLHTFSVTRVGDEIIFKLGKYRHAINISGLHPLHEHLVIKILLNMHSTLVMGRMGRFESNLMTWVKPSNKKLIDRAIRYVQYLLEQENITQFSYEDICRQVFAEAETMAPDQSVVLLTREALRRQSHGG